MPGRLTRAADLVNERKQCFACAAWMSCLDSGLNVWERLSYPLSCLQIATGRAAEATAFLEATDSRVLRPPKQRAHKIHT
jgi:hypothetical protein